MATVNDILKIAKAEIGVKESPANSNDVKYNTWYYKKSVQGAYPWCAVFVSWVFAQADSSLIKKSASCMEIGNWFKSNNQWKTNNPQPGDVVFFKFNTNSRWTNHIGLVESVNVDGSIITIEGNTSVTSNDNGGSVMRRTRKSNIVGYGVPKYSQSSSNPVIPSSNGKLVIDISHHNTIKNWNLITETDSVIIRAGYISYQSGKLTTDKKFEENIKQAISHNKKIGIYAWDQSINEQEAIALANYIIGLIKPYKISLPVYIDSEAYKNSQGRADKISKEQRTKNIISFCKTIKNVGYIPGVYASDSWFKSMLDFEQIKQYEIWCARYSTNKPTINKYEAWQYGSKQFSWSTAPIDVNYFYKDYSNSSSNSSSTLMIKNIVKVNTTLNVRNKPCNGNIVRKLKNGEVVDIIDYQNGWFKIGKDEWVSANYIHSPYGIVTANVLNIRSGAGVNYQDIGDLNKNENVRVLKESNGWYLVLCGTRYGWASAKYIQLI